MNPIAMGAHAASVEQTANSLAAAPDATSRGSASDQLRTDDGFVALRKKVADAALSDAREALSKGDLDSAKAAFIAALEAHPGQMSVYREIGSCLSGLGLTSWAEHCFRGVLPESVATDWFGGDFDCAEPRQRGAETSSSDKNTVWSKEAIRVRVHEPCPRPLRKPGGIVPPTDRMFRPARMTATEALVDSAPGGSLWFDGFNRVVLDRDGKSLDRHTRGNPAVVRHVMQTAQPMHVPGRVFFVGNRGYSNYYHWMFDILPSIDLFRNAGYTFNENDHIAVYTSASRFQKAALRHLGFPEERVVELGGTTPWIEADEMVVPYYANSMAMAMGEWVPRFLKSLFIDQAPAGVGDKVPSADKLYLSRTSTARNGRSIGNEAELIRHLEQRGFTTVYPEDYSVFEQAALFSQAKVVLAAHGAGLTNITFCAPGTRVIELYGDFMQPCYWVVSDLCELDYYNHYCGRSEEMVDYYDRSHENLHQLMQTGFSVDMKELDELLAEAGCH